MPHVRSTETKTHRRLSMTVALHTWYEDEETETSRQSLPRGGLHIPST